MKSISTSHTTKSISSVHWNQVKFDPPTETKPISPTVTKTKSTSMLTLKLSNFRPAYQNQIDFDHPHKNQANQSLHLKQMIVGPRTKNNSILTIRTEPSQSIPTLKTNEFGPDTKTKSNSIPTLKTKSISIHTPTQSNFRPAHKNEVNFDPRTKIKSISIPTLNSSQFRSRTLNQNSNFDPSLKWSQFRFPLLYQVDFDAPTQKRR